MGTDTMFQAGCGTLIWGQTRCPICRSRTFNVKRSTLNFQRGDRKGARWAGYGDRHDIWAPGLLTRASPSACQPVETHWGPPLPEKGDRDDAWATGLLTAGPGGAPGGRSRPATARRYGDRHDVWGAGGSNRGTDVGTDPAAGLSNRAVARTCGDRHDVRYTDQERSTSNVQLATFNWVTEKAHGWQDMGTDMMFGRSAVQIEGQARYLFFINFA